MLYRRGGSGAGARVEVPPKIVPTVERKTLAREIPRLAIWADAAVHIERDEPFIFDASLCEVEWNICSEKSTWMSTRWLASEFADRTAVMVSGRRFDQYNADYHEVPMKEAAKQFFEDEANGTPTYMTWTIDSRRWEELLRSHIKLPGIFYDRDIVEKCIGDEFMDEYIDNQFWHQIYAGTSGVGMKMHQDIYRTSLWSVQLEGYKRWYFCPPKHSENVYKGKVDAFHPDYEKHPLFRNAESECYDTIVKPGEIVFWPSVWFHQTSVLPGGSTNLLSVFLNQAVLGKFDPIPSLGKPDLSSGFKDRLRKCVGEWRNLAK